MSDQSSDQMALLMSTDDWDKVEVCAKFLAQNRQVVWRTKGRNRRSLQEIPDGINLYLFHRNDVKYRCKCIKVLRDCDPSDVLKDVPPEFRDVQIRYTLFIWLADIQRVKDTPISEFRKWRKPKESFDRGLLGLQKVYDLPIPAQSA